ncbi:hypothetical protein M422DRAFT_255261 [Sphaerobolus stellatus SS14]|uniref:Uncharacterized protein n=1 Tax=Sphaerobolus stellatus (strain SS14) TaxID=990650 RepID=A0A0C9UF45_SPHS4|nr:hypothetical protein M422DRAFT_255261 [Sphaerobolus stellatus SS14]
MPIYIKSSSACYGFAIQLQVCIVSMDLNINFQLPALTFDSDINLAEIVPRTPSPPAPFKPVKRSHSHLENLSSTSPEAQTKKLKFTGVLSSDSEGELDDVEQTLESLDNIMTSQPATPSQAVLPVPGNDERHVAHGERRIALIVSVIAKVKNDVLPSPAVPPSLSTGLPIVASNDMLIPSSVVVTSTPRALPTFMTPTP